MEEKREREQEEAQYELRELVWAKITGFPWWPARITRTPSPQHPLYRVDFFSDNTHAFLDSTKIAKYNDLRVNIDITRTMGKGLKKAIVEADRALEEQQAMESSGSPPAAVQVLTLNQKQLLELPLLPPLQENFPTDQVVQPLDHQSLPQESPQLSAPQQQSPHLAFSRHQRKQFVNNLLKKYKLLNLPKLPPPTKHNHILPTHKLRRRKLHPRRPAQPKTKFIIKSPHQQHSLSFLLTRKIFSLLKQKQGLSTQQRKQISMTLTRQLLCGGGGPEELNRLFKWINISPADTISNFYENWGSLQLDKEKPSYMTTEE